jgi:hypothetical protein
MTAWLVAFVLAAAPVAAAPDLPTQPADRGAFCAHMHLRTNGQVLDIDPGTRIDTNEFSGTIGPGAIMYRDIDIFSWIVDHCKGLVSPAPAPLPGVPT